jgi:hypothetical protein
MMITTDQLSAYYDGELGPDEHRQVASHVAQCADCREALGTWRSASAALVRAPAQRPAVRRRWAIAAVGIAAVVLAVSGTAAAQTWFSEIFHIGNVSAAASRPVSLEEARTTGLPLPSTAVLPGGWTLHGKGAVQLTRTPTWTVVELQYDRAGQRGMNIRTSSGIGVFDPTRAKIDEVLNVSGVPVYVVRRQSGGFEHVNAYFEVRGATVEVFAFGPALGGRPLTSDDIAMLVSAWLRETAAR